MDRSKTFIPKGHYDQTNKLYRNDVDASTLSVNRTNEFNKITNGYGTYETVEPINMLHNNMENPYQLGDSYQPPKKTNMGGYGKPIHPYTSYDILKDDVTDLFKKLDGMPANNVLVKRTDEKVLESTHNNNVTKADQYGMDRSVIPAKYTDETKINLLDMNVKGVKDHVVEHTIYINSNNRDTEQYPNPFNYRVDFNPVNGNTNAYIGRMFKNVKYIDIKSVTTPRRYYINKYNITLTNNTNPGSNNEFVAEFINTSVNASMQYSYKLYRGKFEQNTGPTTITYYFYYYEIVMTDTFYIIRYDLFLDEDLKQRVTINIDNGATNKQIIDSCINASGSFVPSGSPIYTYIQVAPVQIGNTNYMVMVNLNTTDKKVKFSIKNDVFEDIIDHVFEFSYGGTVGSYSVTNNYIMEYVLSETSLEDDRYLLLNIKELESNYEYTTEQNINNNFSILFPDYINGDYFYLNTSYQDKVFNKGVLGNVKKLTICFRNSSNTNIKISNANYIDYDITSATDQCICSYDSTTGEKVRDYTCSHSYLRHGGYEKLQNTIMMKLGLVEGYQEVLELQSV